MLSKYLNRENARELLQAATHKTKAEIELLIAQRFPQPDLPSRVRALPVAPKMEVVPEPVETSSAADAAGSLPGQVPTQEERSASDSPGQQVPEPVTHAKPHRIAPLAPRRFALQATISQETHDKLRRIQDLLGHSLPSGDVAEVLDRAFDALLQKLEKAKFAATDHPRKRPAPHSANPRYIPANVKREVWKRDEGRCTHVGEGGERCSARRFLEFDHVLEVSRGGKASVGEIRLLCRTHNQYAAERTFGLLFMRA